MYPYRLSLFAAAILFAVPPAAAAAAEDEAYRVPKAVVSSRVETIAIATVHVPTETTEPLGARQAIAASVTHELQRKGYEVVPPAEYEALWRTYAAKLGKVFDPNTGQRDEKKAEAVFDLTGRELASRHGVDAVLFVHVYRADLFPTGGYEELGPGYRVGDQKLRWQGETVGNGLLWHPQRIIGNVIDLVLVDLSGATMYATTTPIEWTRIYLARSHEDVPPSAQLRDRVPRAVERGLDDLVARQATDQAPSPAE